MFKKLLKYDMKSVAKLWWIGAVASVAAAIISGFLIKNFIYVVQNETENVVAYLASILGIIFGVLCVLAIPLSFVFTLVLVLVRFYRHFFTDEGYLTFTLPVKRSTLLLSKTVNSLIWFSAHFAVEIISFLILLVLVIPAENGAFINLTIFEEIGKGFTMLWDQVGAWLIVYILEAVLIIFATLIFSITMFHFCITFGSVLVKKAKILVSIGIYYGFNAVFNGLTQFGIFLFGGFISEGIGILMINATKNQNCATAAFLILSVFSAIAAISAALYSITQYMLERKLNLA